MKNQILSGIAICALLLACGEATEQVEPETTDTTTEEEAVVPEVGTLEMRTAFVYTGTNLFIKNPYSSTGVGWCVKDVLVNGSSTGTGVETDSFEIDLAAIGLSEGDSVSIVLVHEVGCLPQVLDN